MSQIKGPTLSICCSSRKVSVERFGESVKDLLKGLLDIIGQPVVSLLRYGGGSQGLMGVVREFADSHNIPIEGHTLVEWKEDHIDDVLHEKLVLRQEQVLDADLLLILPGGVGTAFEWFHAQCESDIGHRHRKVILYNPDDWFGPLVSYLDQVEQQGFTRPVSYEVVTDASSLRDILLSYSKSDTH